MYPVELLVTADRAESEPSRVEWRVLTADGAASGGPVTPLVLKLRFAPPTEQTTRRQERTAPADAPPSAGPEPGPSVRRRPDLGSQLVPARPGQQQRPPAPGSVRLPTQSGAAVPRAENNAGRETVERPAETGPRPGRPGLRDKLTDATAEYVADKITPFAPQSLQWASTDLLNPADLSTALDRCQQALHNLAQRPSDQLLTRAGAAPPVAVAASAVGANLVLAPVDQFIGSTSQLIDVAGILIGAVAGLHPLVIACANRLANVQVQNAAAHVLAEALGAGPRDPAPTEAPEPAGQNAAADLPAGAPRGGPPDAKARQAEAGMFRAGPDDAKEPRAGKIGPGAGPRMGP